VCSFAGYGDIERYFRSVRRILEGRADPSTLEADEEEDEEAEEKPQELGRGKRKRRKLLAQIAAEAEQQKNGNGPAAAAGAPAATKAASEGASGWMLYRFGIGHQPFAASHLTLRMEVWK
jgi:hypothetical protein